MDGDELKKCKGVKKYVGNKEITLNDNKKCLFSGRQQLRPLSETNECDSESSSRSFHRASQQIPFVC